MAEADPGTTGGRVRAVHVRAARRPPRWPPRSTGRPGAVHRRPQVRPPGCVLTVRRPLTDFVHKVVPTLCTKRVHSCSRCPEVAGTSPPAISAAPAGCHDDAMRSDAPWKGDAVDPAG